MEYVKFWIAKDLWELSVVLAVFGVVAAFYFIVWVVDNIKAKRRRKAEAEWFEKMEKEKRK